MMLLNVGCGDDRPGDPWINVDPRPNEIPGTEVIIARPEARPGLPFIAGMFDGAVAHHVLQMVPWPDLIPWLAEVKRVLRPGGVLRITTPDIFRGLMAVQGGDGGWFPIHDAIEASPDGKFCVWLSQCGATRTIFTEAWLQELCRRAGFTTVDAEWYATAGPAALLDLDSRWDESIVVEAVA